MRNLLTTFWQWTAGRTGPATAGARAWLMDLANGPLFRASSLSVLDQIVVSGTNFGTSVLIGRSTGAWELGAFYLAMTIVLFSRGVQEQLVGAPYMIYCQRKSPAELKTFGGSALIHQLMLSVVIVSVLGALSVTGLLPNQLQPVVYVLLGALPLLLIREFVREITFAHLRPLVALTLDSAIAFVQLSTLAVLASYEMLSVPLTFIVMGGAAGSASLVWFFLKPQQLSGFWSEAWIDWWKNWTFSRWALASQLLGQTTSYIMPWALAAARDEAATGIFGACNTLVGLANMFVLGLSNFVSPRTAQAFARGGLPELKSVLRQTITLFILSLGLFAVASFLVGEWIATCLYGSSLVGSGPIIGVLALGVVANSVSMVCGNGLWAMERPAANFAADVCVMTTVVIGSLTLIPLWGPLGAAMAMLLAHLTAASVRGWTLLRVMREVAVEEGSR
jgi:O-antigen/teichoic acid export membrane protein